MLSFLRNLFFIVLALAFFSASTWPLLMGLSKYWVSETYKAVPVTITSSQIVENKYRDGTPSKTYTIAINYWYQIGKQDYQGNQIAEQFNGYMTYPEAAEIIQLFPAGAKTVGFFNPSKPSQSVLLTNNPLNSKKTPLKKIVDYGHEIQVGLCCLFFSLVISTFISPGFLQIRRQQQGDAFEKLTSEYFARDIKSILFRFNILVVSLVAILILDWFIWPSLGNSNLNLERGLIFAIPFIFFALGYLGLFLTQRKALQK